MIITNFGGQLIFRQLFDRVSCTFTYLLGCRISNQVILIDPVKELVDRDLSLIQQLGMKLRYVANTHVHADHISGSAEIKAKVPEVESIISRQSGGCADILVNHGELIEVGNKIRLKVISTPGHTLGCVSYGYETSAVFTGDALLVRGCGRTDFQQGDAGRLYDSVQHQLFSLPGDCLVFPGHSYTGHQWTTIGEEKHYNPRLTKSRNQFIQLMGKLNLPKPKLIDIAVPQNLQPGM